ncbi:MAG: LD-carboxypeptidase, partial [Lachnospiraceae bacterium]|nr:LD-carboxypeptidase [Lachnospiraceae bacterium]
CDTMSVYGPCAPAFGMKPWHPALQDVYDIITGQRNQVAGYPLWEKESLKDEEHPLEPYHVTEARILRKYPDLESVAIKGRLIGGCLDCLGNLVGTVYDRVTAFADRYQEDGLIWYLEACDLNPLSIRRTLWQLSHAEWFQHVRGFLIGRPLCFGAEEFGLDQYQAVLGILEQYQVPVIMDVDIGHLPPMMPMVNGAMADITIQGNDITIRYDDLQA